MPFAVVRGPLTPFCRPGGLARWDQEAIWGGSFVTKDAS